MGEADVRAAAGRVLTALREAGRSEGTIGRYQAVLPAFISGWDAKALKARVVFGLLDQEVSLPPANARERRYALREVKQRLHQATFREAVISAYDGRCALSGLPEPLAAGRSPAVRASWPNLCRTQAGMSLVPVLETKKLGALGSGQSASRRRA